MPLSWCYGLGVGFRNFLFDIGVLKSRAFNVPVIAVGNITVGGTGKTPHVEYLIELLRHQFNVAVLSRGYKRKTRGFLKATESTLMREIGDEPYQMKQKFPNVTIAVDKKRTRGIDILTREDSGDDIDVVVLDDAFQHRYVKPGVNILLVDYHRLIVYDKLLPAGRLREPLKGKDRADIVIVTKCPTDLKPMEFRVITKVLQLYPYQQLFFSTLRYEPPVKVFNSGDAADAKSSDAADAKSSDAADGINNMEALKGHHVLLLTGIASPRQLHNDLLPHAETITLMAFPDHHNFSMKDVRQINEQFTALPQPRCIITTEKDAARLQSADGLSDEVRRHLYELPVRIQFMLEQEQSFNEFITGYVRKNSKNSILIKPIHHNNNGPKANKPKPIKFNKTTIKFTP